MDFRAAARALLRGGDAVAAGSPRNEEALEAFLEAALREMWTQGRKEGAADLAEKLTRKGEPLRFRYRNWRGEERERVARPVFLWWDSTEHHPVGGWLLRAVDLEYGGERDFALSGILAFHSR